MVVFHTATALGAIGLGAFVLSQRKGTKQHVFLGRVWTGTMLATSVTSYKIKELNQGSFSWIHGLSTFTIASLGAGIYCARTKNVVAHKGFMRGSLFGAVVAGLVAVASPTRRLNDLVVA